LPVRRNNGGSGGVRWWSHGLILALAARTHKGQRGVIAGRGRISPDGHRPEREPNGQRHSSHQRQRLPKTCERSRAAKSGKGAESMPCGRRTAIRDRRVGAPHRSGPTEASIRTDAAMRNDRARGIPHRRGKDVDIWRGDNVAAVIGDGVIGAHRANRRGAGLGGRELPDRPVWAVVDDRPHNRLRRAKRIGRSNRAGDLSRAPGEKAEGPCDSAIEWTQIAAGEDGVQKNQARICGGRVRSRRRVQNRSSRAEGSAGALTILRHSARPAVTASRRDVSITVPPVRNLMPLFRSAVHGSRECRAGGGRALDAQISRSRIPFFLTL